VTTPSSVISTWIEKLVVAEQGKIKIPAPLHLGAEQVPHVVKRLSAWRRIVVQRRRGRRGSSRLGGNIRLAKLRQCLELGVELGGRGFAVRAVLDGRGSIRHGHLLRRCG